MQQVSRALVGILKLREAFRGAPYRDSKGFWTWGYGCWLGGYKKLVELLDAWERMGKREPMVICEEFAAFLLEQEAVATYGAVVRLYWGLSKTIIKPGARMDALVSMAYTMGVAAKGGLGGFHDMNGAIAGGDWATVAMEAKDSGWYRDVKGERGDEVCAMLRSDEYPGWVKNRV